MTQTVIVIPARYGSSRFPGKPLQPVLGVSMLERVWRIAKSIEHKATVVIATDDERIIDFAKRFGAMAVLTSTTCANGTERTAEAVRVAGIDAEIIVNFQGDALLTPPWVLDSMIQELELDVDAEIVTPAVELQGEELRRFLAQKAIEPASGTLVVFDLQQRALYFSKCVIPFVRTAGYATIHRHIGLYAFRRKGLERYVHLPSTPLEKTEGLEQLRALEHGMVVKIALVDYAGRSHGSIDSPGDVSIVEQIIAREGELVSGSENWRI